MRRRGRRRVVWLEAGSGSRVRQNATNAMLVLYVISEAKLPINLGGLFATLLHSDGLRAARGSLGEVSWELN